MDLIEDIGLKQKQAEKISNMEFKKEHLGALEFDLKVTDAEFEQKDVHFRIERVPVETFLKIGNLEDISKMVPKTLTSFIALPLEAKQPSFFAYDADALSILSTIISKFQSSPILFK